MKNLITLGLAIIFDSIVFGNSINDGVDPTARWKKWANEFKLYPEQAAEQMEEGTVYVFFEITEDGTAQNIKIENGISDDLNEKAIEIVSTMPLDHLIDSLTDGARFILPVKFSIQ